MASNFLKLKSLSIKGYKNIKDIEIDFKDKNGITVLIGKNGCGKSNVLEALSSIFAGLYKNKLHKSNFDYKVSYELKGKNIEIEFSNSIYNFIVDKNSYNNTDFNKNAKEFLPTNVITCYSGESQRLWKNFYWPYYKEYITNIKKPGVLPELPMLYINRYNLSLSLLTLFLFDFNVFTDIRDFCNKTLKIKDIDNIVIQYDLKKIKEWNDNSVLRMIKQLNNVEDIAVLSEDKVKLTLYEIKERISNLGEKLFFKTMYAATMPRTDKIVTKIDYNIILGNGEIININDLSEGEKKNILMTTILEVLADENSLLLFDEPDAHIHISRKAQLKELFDKYPHRENVITTHSPTLAVKFEGHIEGLKLDSKGDTVVIDSEKAKLVSSITDNMWNIHEQNMFLASNKPITLLVEGQTDKIHILAAYKALQAEYPDLEFDVFSFGGADNIPQFMIGLKTCEIDFSNRKIIAIFDNDKEGRDCQNKTQVKYNEKKINKYGLYAITLPSKGDATIENLYDESKYYKAFKNIVEKNSFNGLISMYSEKITKEAKIEMSNMVGTFDQDEFNGFRTLFGLLQEINKL